MTNGEQKQVTDDGAAERLREFTAQLDKIALQPDWEAGFDRIETVIKALTGSTDEEVLAAQKLGEAFATITEYRDHVPSRLYNDLGDLLDEWIEAAHWQADPQLCRQILPLLLAKAIKAEAEEIKQEALP